MTPDLPPLVGTRVVEFTGGRSETTGRILASLGADVVLVEFGDGSPSRRRGPLSEGVSLYFASRNAGKRSLVVDTGSDADRARIAAMLSAADVVIDSHGPGELAARGVDLAELIRRRPDVVVASITDFGRRGAYSGFRGSDAALAALGGVLSRSGLPGRAPVLPPAHLVTETGAVHAAWCILLALWNRVTRGIGDDLDISLHDAVAQIFDPALGVTGTAATGRSALTGPRGRVDESHRYPIVPAADGHVRIAVLAPRQWHALRSWLGDPEDLCAPELDETAVRFAQWHRIAPAVAELFASRTVAELVAEGQSRGIAVEKVAVPADVLADEHFAARGAFAAVPVGASTGALASGFVEIDGRRTPVGGLGPLAASEPGWSPRKPSAPSADPGRLRPLSGLRALDLGVIVAGAELGRLFASQGAEVIKVENTDYPDGSRRSAWGATMNPSFASGHRGKLSLGLDLRSEQGRLLFLDLVRRSDLVLSNFKPGTLDKLGIGPDVLREVNPRIVVVDSSALGGTGPRRGFMGYGPLVRAATALTDMWRDLGVDDGFCDTVTIYPDHLVARVCAIGAMAMLVARAERGCGGRVSVSQAETILNSMPEVFLAESLPDVAPGDEMDLVLECAGDDEWCALSLADRADRDRLAGLVGTSPADDDQLAAATRRWAAGTGASTVMTMLQDAGLAAGAMLRPADFQTDLHLADRRFIRWLDQPGLVDPLPVENAPCASRHLFDPDLAPAPLMFEHTRRVARDVLGLSTATIDELIADGVLEVLPGLRECGAAADEQRSVRA